MMCERARPAARMHVSVWVGVTSFTDSPRVRDSDAAHPEFCRPEGGLTRDVSTRWNGDSPS